MTGYWNIKDVQEYTKIPENTIRSYIRKRAIPFIKVPGSSHIRFFKDDIDTWMMKGKQTPEDFGDIEENIGDSEDGKAQTEE